MPAKIYLRKKIADRISLGHPWVFANEIGDVEGFEKAGAIVSVFSSNGSFVGKGYYNPESKISVRLLTRQPETEINRSFFLKQLKRACDFRRSIIAGNVTRLVSGEADFLPGLEIDKIPNYLIFRTYTLGMELWKATIVSCLEELFPGHYIYEKNEGHFRKAENLPDSKGFRGNSGSLEFVMEEDGIRILVNLDDDPKPGLYWEQLLLSRIMMPFVKGKRVLDAFCYHGFTIFGALKNGAIKAMGIDWLENVIAVAEKSKSLNAGISEAHFMVGNSFSKLEQLAKEKEQFDVIILDPPSMAGIGKGHDKALSGYERLLNASMDLLSEKGLFLLTMSGHQIPEELLFETVNRLVQKKGKKWRILSVISQPPDHPVLWQMPATQYFRGWLIELMAEV